MVTIHRPLAQLAARRHGILTTDDFTAHGVTADMRRHLVKVGAIHRVHRGAYRVGSSPDTFESRCAAACLASGGVITGRAAGALWGCRHVRQPDTPAILLQHSSNSLAAGALIRRTNVLDEEDQVARNDGIVVASPARTWFDLARDQNDARFEATTEWVLNRHCELPMLWRTLRRLGTSGRTGTGRVRRVMSQRSDWQRPAGSKLELEVLNGLRDRGVPELVRQHPIQLPNGIVVHPDGADPVSRWAIEIDHVTWHGGRFDAQRDKQRDRWLRKEGWVVERITDQALRENRARELDDVAEMYFAHVGGPG